MPPDVVMRQQNQRILRMPKLPKEAFNLPIEVGQPAFNPTWEGWTPTPYGIALEVMLSDYGGDNPDQRKLLQFGQDFLNANVSRYYRVEGEFDTLTAVPTKAEDMITIHPHMGAFDKPSIRPGGPPRGTGNPALADFVIVRDGHHRLFWSAYLCQTETFDLVVGDLFNHYVAEGTAPRNACDGNEESIRPFSHVYWYLAVHIGDKEDEKLKANEASLKSVNLDLHERTDNLTERVARLEQKVAYLENKGGKPISKRFGLGSGIRYV